MLHLVAYGRVNTQSALYTSHYRDGLSRVCVLTLRLVPGLFLQWELIPPIPRVPVTPTYGTRYNGHADKNKSITKCLIVKAFPLLGPIRALTVEKITKPKA